MKGDFTRGHRPDEKRKVQLADRHGKKYRRVLQQEGRLVLDSDIAASVDAFDTIVRDLAADVGCRSGSPDLGYLLTPGPLFALFESKAQVDLPAEGSLFVAYRDHGRKYKERFPSLFLDAAALAGTVTLHGRSTLVQADYPKLRFWTRADSPSTLTLVFRDKATSLDFITTTAIAASADFLEHDVDVPAGVTSYDTLQVGYGAAAATHQVWIGLVEGREQAQAKPFCWATWGRYYLDGLEVELNHATEVDGQYPEVTFPSAAGFENPDLTLAAGSYLVAYLEGWERLVTRVEDPGILEQALGGSLDTTVRSQPLGQVKLAFFDPSGGLDLTSALQIPQAFANLDAGTALLDVTTAPSGINLDPCAIPEAGGYTGADNRLYRFEVHEGGDLGDATIKWSKNNGSDLFAVASFLDNPSALITLAPGSGVREGDLVELLFEPDDLGDQSAASLSLLPTPSFRPPARRAGLLCYVKTTNKTDQVTLQDFTNPALPATLTNDLTDQPGPKLRIWHGLLDTAVTSDFDIGDGVSIQLSGASFRPGDYWQYEARKLKDNANGPWQKSPHGPERLFAPLALFRYVAAGDPLVLERWYDHRFSAICALDADDIAYDGDKAGTDADTVQEALDELYDKIDEGGCCDVHLDAGYPGDDDGARIQQVIDNDLPNGGVICLKPGTYHLATTIVIEGKKIEIVGCPRATLLGESDGPAFHLKAFGELILTKIVARSGPGAGPVVLLLPDLGDPSGEGAPPGGPKLGLRETALLHTGDGGVAVHEGAAVPVASDATLPYPSYPVAETYLMSRLRAEDSILVAPRCVLADTLSCAVTGSMLVFEHGGISAGSIGGLEIQRSSLRAGLDSTLRASLQSAAPEGLEAELTHALENLYGYPAETSIAVLAGYVSQANLTGNDMAAGACVVAFQILDGQSSDNRYDATTRPSFRVDYANHLALDSDRLASQVVGLHVPWYALELRVERCALHAKLGVVVGAGVQGEPLPSPPYGFTGLRLLENQVINPYGYAASSPSVGILLGPVPGGAENAVYTQLDQVEIARNVSSETSWLAPDVFILTTLLDPAFDPDKPAGALQTRSIRIEDNRIFGGHIGIGGFGPGLEVRRNTISLQAFVGGALSGATGILLNGATSAVVSENVIRIEDGIGAGMEVKGIQLEAGQLEGANRDALLEGNRVEAGPTSVVLQVRGDEGGNDERYLRLRLDGNDFTGGSCSIESADGSILRNNRFACDLLIQEAVDGIVSDNFVGQGLSQAGSPFRLEITEATGSWQLEDNRSEGHIILRPALIESGAAGLEYLSHFANVYAGKSRGDDAGAQAEWLHTALAGTLDPTTPAAPLGELLGQLGSAMLGALFGASPSSKKVSSFSDLQSGPDAAARRSANVRPIEEIFLGEAAAGVYEVLSGLGAMDSLLVVVEAPYQAQVIGNWAAQDLVVGHPPETETTREGLVYIGVLADNSGTGSNVTTVQINDNRTEQNLITNAYTNLVKCDNLAHTYIPTVTSLTPPVIIHNLAI